MEAYLNRVKEKSCFIYYLFFLMRSIIALMSKQKNNLAQPVVSE